MEKKASFWVGFEKRAKEQLEVEAAPAEEELDSSNEKKLKWNPEGGVDPRSPEAMQIHESLDVKTLPEGMEGASCGTCEHIRILDPATGVGFCTNPALKIDVTTRMLCSQWSAPGVYRASEAIDPSQVVSTQMAAEAQGLGVDPNQMDPSQPQGDPGQIDPNQAQGDPNQMDPSQAQGDPSQAQSDPAQAQADPAQAQAAPAKKKKEPPKKPGHNITVNVGEEKKASVEALSFWHSLSL